MEGVVVGVKRKREVAAAPKPRRRVMVVAVSPKQDAVLMFRSGNNGPWGVIDTELHWPLTRRRRQPRVMASTMLYAQTMGLLGRPQAVQTLVSNAGRRLVSPSGHFVYAVVLPSDDVAAAFQRVLHAYLPLMGAAAAAHATHARLVPLTAVLAPSARASILAPTIEAVRCVADAAASGDLPRTPSTVSSSDGPPLSHQKVNITPQDPLG